MSINVDARILRARSHLILDHAFFGSLAMRLKLVERSDIPTMATDGTSLFYSRGFLDSITSSVTLFVVAHEVLHCALGHHVRRKGRDHMLWNMACDYVVNWMLKQAGFTAPDYALLDPAYAGLNAEEVYRILKKKQQDEQQQNQPDPNGQSGQSGQNKEDDDNDDQEDAGQDEEGTNGGDDQCTSDDQETSPTPGKSQATMSGTSPSESEGSGSTSTDPSVEGDASGSSDGTSTQGSNSYPPSHGDPGRCGEILDAAPQYDQPALDEAAEEWKVYTRQAANVARRHGEGRVPGFMEEVIQTLNEPEYDWREELRRFWDPFSATKDHSWSNPNRRHMALGYFTPGTISDGTSHLGLLIDSSASMNTTWLTQISSEAQRMLDEGAVDKVTVVVCDTQVHKTAEYNKGELIDTNIPGRGGTRFAPAFEWLNEHAPDVTAAIYFTDLECSDFGPEPAYPVLWTAYGDPRFLKQYMKRVPFGECIELRN